MAASGFGPMLLATILVVFVKVSNSQSVLPVRFSQKSVEVVESNGSVTVCAMLTNTFNGTNDVDVTFSTADGTATAGGDYVALSPLGVSVTLSPQPGRRQMCIQITIIDDAIVEDGEEFFVFLNSSVLTEFRQPMLTVQIIDDDNATSIPPPPPQVLIALSRQEYTVMESEGSLEICVMIVMGIPQKDFEASLSVVTTEDTSAEVEVDFKRPPNGGRLFFPANSTESRCLMLSITANDGREGREQFTVRLSVSGDSDASTFVTVGTMGRSATVTILDPLPPPPRPSSSPPPTPDSSLSQTAIIGIAVGGALATILTVTAMILVTLLCCWYCRKSTGSVTKKAYVHSAEEGTSGSSCQEFCNITRELNHHPYQLQPISMNKGSNDPYKSWRAIFASLIVNPSQLEILESLGAGAFGEVRKGWIIKSQGSTSKYTQVAIKSLKKSPSQTQIEEFITESAIMLDFSHPNVMRLVGVCFDTEDGLPLIILPYMANGDLKNFLRSKRSMIDGSTTTGSVDNYPLGFQDTDLVRMCLNVASGMEYLSRAKFVHRDLAARNCMVDEKLRVCVADFGLSKDVYSSEYYRLTHAAPLPVKWMAPESLYDNMYSEKTDVWSFGVVCWEVFSLGQVPFPGVDNADIPDYISRGHRLRQPSLCPDEMYKVMQMTWKTIPEERASFTHLVSSLENVLEQNHDYLVLCGASKDQTQQDSSSTSKLVPLDCEIPLSSQTPTPTGFPTIPYSEYEELVPAKT